MNEIELLKELIKTEGELQIQNLNVHYAETPEKIELENKRKQDIESKVELLKIELIDINDKTHSKEAKYAIIKQLRYYIEEINKANPGLKLSRKQGMILENMLFGFISKDIHNLISDRVFGIHIPAYLVYTYDKKDSVEISELTDFLNEEIQIVNAIENPNYVNLKDYYAKFRERIVARFMAD